MSRAITADTHVACFSRGIKMELSVSDLLNRDRSEITKLRIIIHHPDSAFRPSLASSRAFASGHSVSMMLKQTESR